MSARASDLIVLFAAAAFAATSVVRVTTTEPLPDPLLPELSESYTTAKAAAPMTDATELQRALDLNPFWPARTRPPVRFPQAGSAPAEAAPAPAAASQFKLLGTTVLPSGGFAIVERAGEPPTVVRVGANFHGLTLTRVERGRVTFKQGESSIVLELPGNAR